jgi:hypothetical protein
MPHKIIAVAVRAKLALYYLIAAVAEVVGCFIGGGF